MFPATGSTTTHASPSPYCATASAAASTSLYGATMVCAVTDPGNAERRRDPERRKPRPRFS
jgi:hypothetical protein